MVVKPPDGSAVPAPAPDPAAVAEAHRQLVGDPAIQFDLPRVDLTPPEPPAWLKWLADLFSGLDFQAPEWLRSLFNFFEGVAPGLGTVFYVILAILVLGALFFIIRFAVRRWRGRPAALAEEADLQPDAILARGLLGEADALAARGRFSEAAHLLLFRSIEDIDLRRPELVRPAFTSRDIAGLEPIPSRPRSAFARIAMSVERSLFAQRPLAEVDWRDCRAAYEEFAFAEAWQG